MSIKVMTYVWEHSTQEKGNLLVMLAIADFCHDDGSGAFPAIGTLAKKARLSIRATQYCIASLVKAGELAVEDGAGPNGVNRYTVLMTPRATVAPVQKPAVRGATRRKKGVQPATKGGATGCTQSVMSRKEEPLEREPSGNGSLSASFSNAEPEQPIGEKSELIARAIICECNLDVGTDDERVLKAVAYFKEKYPDDTDKDIALRIRHFWAWWKIEKKNPHVSAPSINLMKSQWRNNVDYWKRECPSGLPEIYQWVTEQEQQLAGNATAAAGAGGN